MAESTHHLTLTGNRVMKRYRSWDRGEAQREWTGLTLVDRYAPGLAPRPLEQRIESGVPVIVMSRLAGEPLGAAPLSPGQLAGLGQALRKMWTAAPATVLATLPERRWGPAESCSTMRVWIAEPVRPVAPVVKQALAAASAWLGSGDADVLASESDEHVFTNADGNLANFLWDGARCRVVDFEDSGVGDPAYEVADLVEHVSVWLPGLIVVDDLVEALGLSSAQRGRLVGYRRLMAVYWLFMLLPGNPAHRRNPPGSTERQAEHLLGLL